MKNSATLLVLALLSAPVAADPYASTVSQIEWNAESQRLEVALRAAPEAIERALTSYFGSKVRLDASDPKLERRMERYLKDTFVVESLAGNGTSEATEHAAIEWLGLELDSHRTVWLYFEVPLEKLENARLTVRLFFEVEPRQLHVVRMRHGETQKAWTLTREQPSRILAGH